jgi:hypothetical protein
MYKDNLACFNTNRDVHKIGAFEWNIVNNSCYICLFFDTIATTNIIRIDSTNPLVSNACIISHLNHGKGIKYDYSHFFQTQYYIYEMIIPKNEYTIYSRLSYDSVITYEEWIDCLYSTQINHVALHKTRVSNNNYSNKYQCICNEVLANRLGFEYDLSIDVPYFISKKTSLALNCTMVSMEGQLGVLGNWFFNKETNNDQYDFVPSTLTNFVNWRLPLNLPFLWSANSSQCNPICFIDTSITNEAFPDDSDETMHENYNQIISQNDYFIDYYVKHIERLEFVVLDLDTDSDLFYYFIFASDWEEFMLETIVNLICSGVTVHINQKNLDTILK